MTTKADEKYIAENQYKNMSITVSVLDPANDFLQFYCEQKGKEITFTDDGYYINAFMLDKNTDFWGLERRGDELILSGKARNFALLKDIYIINLLGVLNGK